MKKSAAIADFADGLCEGLARVLRLDGADLRLVLANEIRDPAHRPGSLAGSRPRPRAGLEDAAGGLDGPIDVLRLAEGDVVR